MSPTMQAEYLAGRGAGRQDVEALLQHSYRWTKAAHEVLPPVAAQIAPALTIATQLYEAGQYDAALSQIGGAIQLVRQARMVYPALPEM